MMTNVPSLSLDQCVETLKKHLSSVSRAQPKELARLYVAAVGLACHLKNDQSVLHKTRKSANEQAGTVPCPSGQEIPAITRIHQDSQLFHSLLTCLKVPDATESSTTDATMPLYSRKRTYSFHKDSDIATPASKMLKIQHSPKKKVAAARSAEHHPEVPNIPVAVLAATVLYSAFQHVDHWPAPLVQAYAEDAFGPRLWVDDERCSLLVQNLSLCHRDLEQESTVVDEATLAQAARVAHYYENIPSERQANGSTIPSWPAALTPQPVNNRPRSMSLGSTEPASTAAAPSSDSDSDSGDEETCLIEVSTGLLARAGNGGGDDSSSSSSGEEDAEVVEMSTTLDTSGSFAPPVSRAASLTSQSVISTPNLLSVFPGRPTSLNLARVRRRFFGVNLEHAQKAITTSLSERLDLKSKQNSKLLMALPSFVCIPAVRRLATQHLERWLQSPALSGQARALFAATVQNMRNVDPPLPDDIQAIDSIMEMRLKTNQLNMHIENVSEIAKRIPNATVARHIFLRILREELAIMESGTHLPSLTEPMKMMNAVYGAFPSGMACEGLAIAFLTLLAEPAAVGQEQSYVNRRERQLRVKKIRSLLRSVASALGSKFDGCGLVESFLSFDVSSKSWSLEDEQDKARLMYECVTLMVPPPADESSLRHKSQRKLQCSRSDENAEDDIAALRSKLKRARKMLLDWCCTEFAQQWQARNKKQMEHDKLVKRRRKKGEDDDVPTGAGTPDFSSVLDSQGGSTKFAECLDIMRCVLFMAGAESTSLREFLYPGDSPEVIEAAWHDDRYRMQQCYEYGSDLDDEMLWIILKSAALPDDGIDPALALALIENLFDCCNKERKAALQLTDSKLVWELYRLAEYCPSLPPDDMKVANGHVQNSMKIPRLAHPGMWWRVTILVLVMCGASPEEIGMEVWNDSPTLQALIKMATSGRYRFPTIDCDEASRSKMKSAETNTRDEESRIAEVLFLPPLPTPKKFDASDNGNAPAKRGSRVSSRQREKQERLLKQQREKEATAALAEANRRKKVLRVAQKSIMLFDPKGPARKPPKEAVPLILSIEQLFSLSGAFQQNVNPDFLLMTIGQTTRGAIERAFDWVIPVISTVPEIINRLPANASCFLLLRAYGEEGEGKSELRQLSTPLVEHVKKSLTGEFGESSALRAADLLLADLADPNPDRRRCVIRVLRETLGHLTSGDSEDSTGLLCLLQVAHAEAIVSSAIKYISQGLAFERGKTLRALVVALDKYISFAAERKVEGSWNFAGILCDLISRRHNVCSEAMDRFPDFRALAITSVHREFLEFARGGGNNSDGDSDDSILIRLCPTATGDDSTSENVSMPLPLLQSACVLLSICKDEENSDVSPTARAAVQTLADALMYPCDQHGVDVEKLAGLASATLGSGDRAVTVEQWVMLAKSRSDFIARRAALSAPALFLPRLLLCSGLPASSLLTMIDRLGKLGDNAEDRGLVFRELLMPSVTNQWASLYPGNWKELARKLIGRLSAYLHLNQPPLEQNISLSFLEWLSEECTQQMTPKKSRSGKKGPKVDQTVLGPLLSAASGGHIVSTLSNLELQVDKDVPELAEGSSIALEPFSAPVSGEPVAIVGVSDRKAAMAFVLKCYAENRPEALNAWLNTIVQRSPANVDTESEQSLDNVSVCTLLLRVLFEGRHSERVWFTNTVLKLVPTLSQLKGGPELWTLVFTPHSHAHVAAELLRDRCALVWCQPHAQECQQWILSNHGGLCIPSVLRFLIATSYQPSIHAHSFISSTTLAEDYWGTSESGLKAGVTIAIQGAKEPCCFDVNDPINLPDWLVVVLLLARTGQQSMMRVCEMLLAAIEKEQDAQIRSRLQSTMLRLYTYFPKRLKLGNAKLRGVLIEGAKSTRWLDWRSSLDAQLDDMLSSLKSNPSKRIMQALMDLSKSHPLLVLRKLTSVVQLLEDDACVSKYVNIRSRMYGENLLGPLGASVSGKSIKVTVRHWGYSFTEMLWISLLDVLMSIPKEVLFSCGSHMGLGEFLGVYAKLLFIQCQLKSNPARIKSKFSDVLNEFKSTDAKGWESWLASEQPDLPSLGNMRNVLTSCSLITPETSVEDLRRAMQS